MEATPRGRAQERRREQWWMHSAWMLFVLHCMALLCKRPQDSLCNVSVQVATATQTHLTHLTKFPTRFVVRNVGIRPYVPARNHIVELRCGAGVVLEVQSRQHSENMADAPKRRVADPEGPTLELLRDPAPVASPGDWLGLEGLLGFVRAFLKTTGHPPPDPCRMYPPPPWLVFGFRVEGWVWV